MKDPQKDQPKRVATVSGEIGVNGDSHRLFFLTHV